MGVKCSRHRRSPPAVVASCRERWSKQQCAAPYYRYLLGRLQGNRFRNDLYAGVSSSAQLAFAPDEHQSYQRTPGARSLTADKAGASGFIGASLFASSEARRAITTSRS
jgi:hypothetical protein